MKTIKLENKDISPAILFLKSLSMIGQPTRGKQKFVERLVEKNNEYLEQEKEVIKRYAKTDEEGNLELSEDGRFDWKDEITDQEKYSLSEEREELSAEIAEISFVEYSNKYEALFEVLDNWQEPITPEYSYIYDKLMDQYEANEETKEEK